MTYFMKIKDYKWKSGSNKEMLYRDDNDEWFVGPPHNNIAVGKTYSVEISEGTLEDGYRHIIKFK
ncbi:MAG: hypothetical protein JXA51_03665 [Dehalococcoidales bacterium]|nr:hypothetical protein [Dehalococcoidales bacterium]